jgi:hypothetical protein
MLDIDKMIKKMLNKTLSKPVTEKKYINNRKFAGASIAKQKQWKSFSPGKKILLRKLYKDSDKDRVPDKWDCQPYNKYRQDSDLSGEEIAEILVKNPDMINDVNINSMNGLHLMYVINHQPQLIDYFNLNKIDGKSWAYILVKHPELYEYADFSKLDNNHWKVLLQYQPQLIIYKR